VFVNGTRIPVANANIHIRKEGPLDVTRYAEVQFPAEYNNNRYVDLFQTKDPDSQDDFDTLYITLRNGNGSFVPAFRGFVTGVGATDSALIWQCRARGPAHMLTSATANKQFTRTTGKGIVDYIVNRLDQKAPFAVSSPSGDADDPLEDIELFKDQETLADFIFPDNDSIPDISPKTFQSNRHTLKDVADWLRSKTSIRLWFEPTDNGVTLLPLQSPSEQSHQAHYLGGELQVISNNALSEIAPVNTIKAKGSATESFDVLGFFELNSDSNKYYIAEARHTKLYERAGQRELEADTWIRSDGNTSQEVAEDARSGLKDAIDEATEGDMITLLSGDVIPFDTIEARPTCRSEAEETVPITYEVNRVEHMVNPSDGQSRSRINVGIHTDLQNDIEILDTWTEKTNKGSDT